MAADRIYLLSLDFERGTITRYVHHRGCHGVRQLQKADLDGSDMRKAAGEAADGLEKFRKTGDASG